MKRKTEELQVNLFSLPQEIFTLLFLDFLDPKSSFSLSSTCTAFRSMLHLFVCRKVEGTTDKIATIVLQYTFEKATPIVSFNLPISHLKFYCLKEKGCWHS